MHVPPAFIGNSIYVRSCAYDRRRYAPKHEQAVHHFHALLHEFLD